MIHKTTRKEFEKKFTHGIHIDLSGIYHKKPIRKAQGEIEAINNILAFFDSHTTDHRIIEEEMDKTMEVIRQQYVDSLAEKRDDEANGYAGAYAIVKELKHSLLKDK